MKIYSLTFSLRITLVLILFFSAFTSQKVAAQTITNVSHLVLSSTRTHVYFTVNPAGANTTVTIQYSLSNNGFSTGALTANVPGTFSGTSAIATGFTLGGLASNQTFYYRVVSVRNSTTTYAPTTGSLTFNSLSVGGNNNSVAPTVSNVTINTIRSTTANAEFTLKAGNDMTANNVSYSTDPNFITGIQTTSGTVVAGGNTNNVRTIALTGLSPNTTYYINAGASNAYGSVGSFVNTSFTTLSSTVSVPVLSGETVSAISNYKANFAFTVNPGNGLTQLKIEYGTSPGLNKGGIISTLDDVIGNTNMPQSKTIVGLLPNKTYYYRITATNSAGPISTVIKSFTTVDNILLSEYNFDGTLNNVAGNSPFATGASISYTQDRNLVASKAMLINGGNGTQATTTGLPVEKTSRSISVWIKPTVIFDDNVVFTYGAANLDAAYGGSFTSSDIYNFTYATSLAYTTTITENIWKHLVYSFDEGTSMAKIYVNGVSASSGTYQDWNATPTTTFYLGSKFGVSSGRFVGAFDDLKIYNYALSDAEVLNLFNSNSVSTSVSNPTKNEVYVKLYPNPVQGILNVETALDICSVEIYNTQGQKVLTSNQKQVNVAGLAAGVYLVKVQDVENAIVTRKITIQ